MNTPSFRYIASIVDSERSIVEARMAPLLNSTTPSIHDARLDVLVGPEPKHQAALQLLRAACETADKRSVATAGDLDRFLRASAVVLDQLSTRRDSLLDQLIKSQRTLTGGAGVKAMAAKSLTIGSIYAAIEVCLQWKGMESSLTRSTSTLGCLIFGLLLTELFYTATRATSSEENARYKGWVAAIAGWLFTATAVSNNVFLVKDIGSITAVSGSFIAWGLVLSIWVMDLARTHGARDQALYRSPIALLAGERSAQRCGCHFPAL